MKTEKDKSQWGVHQNHCCIIHGCKYGDSDCPVCSGEIRQYYLCESCDDDYHWTSPGTEEQKEAYDRQWEQVDKEIAETKNRIRENKLNRVLNGTSK